MCIEYYAKLIVVIPLKPYMNIEMVIHNIENHLCLPQPPTHTLSVGKEVAICHIDCPYTFVSLRLYTDHNNRWDSNKEDPHYCQDGDTYSFYSQYSKSKRTINKGLSIQEISKVYECWVDATIYETCDNESLREHAIFDNNKILVSEANDPENSNRDDWNEWIPYLPTDTWHTK